MLSHLTISRAILLLIILGLSFAFVKYNGNVDREPVIVREYYDCISAMCMVIEGAGDACVYKEPRMSKVTVIADGLGKVIKISPSNDRCY